jgi:hypothetical protein
VWAEDADTSPIESKAVIPALNAVPDELSSMQGRKAMGADIGYRGNRAAGLSEEQQRTIEDATGH